MRRLLAVEMAAGSAALASLAAIEASLDGTGPALLPHAPGSAPPADPGAVDDTSLPDGLAVVVGTSGSTGAPKLALLSAAALLASARATHRRLGGAGRWVLALPAHHVAGMQVLVRSVVAGTTPVAVDSSAGFTAAAFAHATAALSGRERAYTAVVPTQLARLLADPAGTEALRRYDAVLVGAAATPAGLLREAARHGVRVTTTYGMSETAGGCVYDGVPLDCSAHRLDDTGRIELGGDTLADGYLGRPDLTAAAFRRAPPHATASGGSARSSGGAWFRTDDVGSLDERGALVVEGRVDDMISTGGLKVSPRLVEDAVTQHVGGVAEAVVVGLADPEWGQRVGLAVTLSPGVPTPALADVRSQLSGILPAHALPTVLAVLPWLPLRGPGKPDRAAVAATLCVVSGADGTMGDHL